MAAEPVAIGELCIFLLQVGAVEQDEASNVDRRGSRINGSVEALFEEPGQIAAMIEMRMCQHDGFDTRRFYGKPAPIELPELARALEQSAIDQQAAALVFKQVLGACDSPRTTHTRKREGH